MDHLLWKGLKSTGKLSQFKKYGWMVEIRKSSHWARVLLNFQLYNLDPMPTVGGIRGKFNLLAAISKFSNDVSASSHVIDLEERCEPRQWKADYWPGRMGTSSDSRWGSNNLWVRAYTSHKAPLIGWLLPTLPSIPHRLFPLFPQPKRWLAMNYDPLILFNRIKWREG